MKQRLLVQWAQQSPLQQLTPWKWAWESHHQAAASLQVMEEATRPANMPASPTSRRASSVSSGDAEQLAARGGSAGGAAADAAAQEPVTPAIAVSHLRPKLARAAVCLSEVSGTAESAVPRSFPSTRTLHSCYYA